MQKNLTPGIRLGKTPPFYELSSLTFEELCRDLFDAEPSVAVCEIYGDPGQTQDGIDLLAHRKGGEGIEVGQCKCYEDFPPREIHAASDEFFKYWDSHWANENIKRFILFVASDLKTRQRQDEFTNQKKRFAKYGIEYEAWSASKIRNKLRLHPGIVANYLHPKEIWVPEICGIAPPVPASQPLASSSPTVDVILTNQLEKFGEWFSEETERSLAHMREALREGRNSETLKQLQALRKDKDRWSVLSPEVKAKCLCFEGSIVLHLTGDVNCAQEYAAQAHELTLTSNEARLRASIAYTQGRLQEAINYLTDLNDPDSIHLKAALYLELHNPTQCLQTLELEAIVSNPTAETYRLRALSYLVTKKSNQAQLEIQKALELKPNWESVKFSAALIDYYGALSLEAFIGHLIISADPVDWVLVKRDDESLEKLRRAAVRFQDLAKIPDQTQEELKRLQVWLLACLANDPERQEEAATYCLSLLETDPTFTPAVTWALARNYEINLQASETTLEALITDNTASIHQVMALINCYMADQKLDAAIELLERKEGAFQQHNASEAWLLAFSQIQVLRDSAETALEKLNSYGETTKTYDIRIFVLNTLARKTRDWQPLNDFLEQIQNITSDPNLLLIICKLKAEQQDWLYVIENAETLLHHFETAEILRLIAIAAYNAKHFPYCLQLLDNYRHLFPQSKLPPQLRRIRVFCQHEMGILSEAIREAKDLVSEAPTLDNMLSYVNLCIVKGDFKELVLVARQLEAQSDLPPEVALQMSRLLLWEDKQLSLTMWKKATNLELPDEFVGEAFFLGNQLGLKVELKPLFLKIQELAQEGHGGIFSFPPHELLDLVKQGHEQEAKLDEAFRTGQVSIHFVAKEVNASLAVLYHSRLMEYEKNSDPFRQVPLLARHGGRMTMEGFPAPVSKLNIHLDITSVLLAEHLGILSKVEQAFAPLHIPAELMQALIQLREKSTPHQPTRFDENQQIVDLVKIGAITILDEDLPTEFDNATLIAEMGKEWVLLFEAAKKNNGYLVEYLPLTKNDLSGGVPSVLPDGIEEILVNCRAIIESLLQQGPLSKEEYYKALDSLGYEGQVNPSDLIPLQGSPLYCNGAITGTLAGASLLATVCKRFQVYISKQTYQIIQAELGSRPHMRSLADWIDGLISRLNTGLDRQLYQVIPISPNKRPQINDILSQHPLDGVLAALRGFEIKPGDVIWMDDRWLNSHLHRDGVPIADIYDILKLLVGMGQIKKEEYYQILHKLRSGNVIFIPVQRDEIVYHLKQAQINRDNDTIVETQQLKVLRQYIASCLLHKTIMQVPPMPKGSPNEHGEIAFVINLMRAISWAFSDIWTDENIDEENRPILCEWIINNLYLDHLALCRATFLPEEDEGQDSQAILGLVAVLSAPFASKYFDLDKQARSVYFSWLYERILHRRFVADPQLLFHAVESLKRTFQEVKGDSQRSEADSIAIDWLLQTYYNDLPKPIQEELRRDEDFMAGFGLKFIQAVSIDDLSFEPGKFFKAAQKAINGRKSTISPIQDKTKIIFEPIENELALRFRHPRTGEEIRVKDERFVLLLDSVIEREKLLYKRRDWFDCSESDLQKAVTSIAVTDNILRRVEIADEWRESSTYIYYDNLYHRMREQQQIHFPSLIPPSADRLLAHYRLPPATGTGQIFAEVLTIASETLLPEEGLGITIHRLVGFPTPLPLSVLEAIGSLPEMEKVRLIKNLLKKAGSPLSKIHLLKILSHLGDEQPSYYRLARRVIKRFFTDKARAEFIAFLNLLNWVEQEFGYWQDASKWQPHMRLAMVWAHTHQLFSILTAVGVPLDWISKTFKQITKRVPSEMFNRDFAQWFDVSNPRRLNYASFVLMGVADSVGQKGNLILDQVLEELFIMVTFQEINGVVLPSGPFFRDISRASDSLGSILGGDYAKKLIHLLGEDKASTLGSVAYQTLASQALEVLTENPNDLTAWLTLQVTISNLPPYGSLINSLSQLLIQTQFTNLINQDKELALAAMAFAAMQSIHLMNENLNQHLRVQFLQMIEQLAQQDWKNPSPRFSDLNSLYLRLVEVALDIAICSQTINERILLFRDLLSQMVEIWPMTIPTIKPIVQALCEELPVKQGQYFGRLLLRLRAE